jgi:uncharacterized protein YjbJ (UPF0337 family)
MRQQRHAIKARSGSPKASRLGFDCFSGFFSGWAGIRQCYFLIIDGITLLFESGFMPHGVSCAPARAAARRLRPKPNRFRTPAFQTRAVSKTGDYQMDKDRVEGSLKNIKGTAKEGIGKALGDSKLEGEGKMDKVEGKVQNTVGGIKDTLRGKRT